MLCTQLTVMQSPTCTKGKCHCILTCIFLPSPYHSVTPHNGGPLLKNQTQDFFLLKWQLQSIVLEATTGVRHYASLVLQPVAKTISYYTFLCVCVCVHIHMTTRTHLSVFCQQTRLLISAIPQTLSCIFTGIKIKILMTFNKPPNTEVQ